MRACHATPCSVVPVLNAVVVAAAAPAPDVAITLIHHRHHLVHGHRRRLQQLWSGRIPWEKIKQKTMHTTEAVRTPQYCQCHRLAQQRRVLTCDRRCHLAHIVHITDRPSMYTSSSTSFRAYIIYIYIPDLYDL